MWGPICPERSWSWRLLTHLWQAIAYLPMPSVPTQLTQFKKMWRGESQLWGNACNALEALEEVEHCDDAAVPKQCQEAEVTDAAHLLRSVHVSSIGCELKSLTMLLSILRDGVPCVPLPPKT